MSPIGPRRRARQFATRLVKETEETPLVHFPEGKLAPPLDEEKDKDKDLHDLANLVVLPMLLAIDIYYLFENTPETWWFFFGTVTVYFVGDLLWVLLIPKCVKSPFTIKVHHSISIFYLILPFTYPEYGHFLGYCMLVEFNTWFLIARRFWRRRSKIFSIGFYITWVTVRVGLFTYLMVHSFEAYLEKVFPQLDSDGSGTLTRKEIMRLRNWVHLMMLAPMFQTMFCGLNWKWTYDLILKKVKGHFVPVQPTVLSDMAQRIVEECHAKTRKGANGHMPETPIGKGGKMDDTSVVVAEVIEWTEAHSEIWHKLQKRKDWDRMVTCGGALGQPCRGCAVDEDDVDDYEEASFQTQEPAGYPQRYPRHTQEDDERCSIL